MEDDFSLNCEPSNFRNKISNFLDNYSQDYDAITFYGYWKKGLIPVDKDISKFSKNNCSVYGISKDSLESHKKFKKTEITPLSTFIQFILINIITFAGCFISYEIVKRINWLRPFLGMKKYEAR